MPLPELGEFVAKLGFDGIELPARPGFQVEPEQALRQLPVAVKQFAQASLQVFSVAAVADEDMVIACAEAGVPVIRIMASVGPEGYFSAEESYRR